MKKIITIAAIFVIIALALVLVDAFLRRPISGVSSAGESVEPPIGAILL